MSDLVSGWPFGLLLLLFLIVLVVGGMLCKSDKPSIIIIIIIISVNSQTKWPFVCITLFVIPGIR